MPSEAVLDLRKRPDTNAKPTPFVPNRIPATNSIGPVDRAETSSMTAEPLTEAISEPLTEKEMAMARKEARRKLFPQVSKKEIITPTKKAIEDFDMIKGNALL